MAEDLLRKLRTLEEEYAGLPLVAQRADLREINHIRSRLGLPLVDDRLKEIGVAVEEEAKPQPEQVPDHTEAREIYQAYLKKLAELEVHRAYAEQVARATAGHGQTPVRPLATMGTNGGPLLCDYCGRPIVLEGGQYHGVAADVAWMSNPSDNWTSWILGGMVVEIQTNGTLRIYHGYPGMNNNHCCNVASRKDQKAREQFGSVKGREKYSIIMTFLEHEFPDRSTKQHLDLLNEILNTVYSYDPGIGMNRPAGCAKDDKEIKRSHTKKPGSKRGSKPKPQS
jgi:hypothetical protein